MDRLSLLSPLRTGSCLYAAPSSPRLCVIPPTPTGNTNPSGPLLSQKQTKEERLLPLMGPRFPKTKNRKGKRRPVVVVPSSGNQRRLTHRRQTSAPFDLTNHSPYQRQNSTKSLVTDLSDLRHLLEQEDLRHTPDSPGSSRFMRAIRHFPRKVSALRGKLQSDDSDLDTISCSSTKSLSLDLRRKAQKRNSNDSVTAALIRSIIMDSGRDLSDCRGLSRVVEGEETAVSAPTTPKSNLLSSQSELELGGANELIHQMSSDIDDGIAFIESSSSSSCSSSTSGDDITDSSAIGTRDENNSLVGDFDLQEEKMDDDNLSESAIVNAASNVEGSPGKASKTKVTFFINNNEIYDGRRKKSRSLSPQRRKATVDVFRKEVSLSPIRRNHHMVSQKVPSENTGNNCHPLQYSDSVKYVDFSLRDSRNFGLSPKNLKIERKEGRGSLKSPKVHKILPATSPFDEEFGAAALLIKTIPGGVNVEDLPQPFEIAKTLTPPNTGASPSLSTSPSIFDFDTNAGNCVVDLTASASQSSDSACLNSSSSIADYSYNMKGEDRKQNLLVDPLLNSSAVSLPLLGKSNKRNIMTNFTKILGNPIPQPNECELESSPSMYSSSNTSIVTMTLKREVSDNSVCSLTLDIPRVLSPLHKSRSTTSLVCRHEVTTAAAAATHFATEGEREGAHPIPHDEEQATSHGPAQLSVSAHKHSQSPAKVTSAPAMHRRSSDSDLSVTPKGEC